MNTFEIGKEYYSRSIYNHDCVFTIKITGRTAKTVTYEYMGESRRSKIRVDDSGEYIQPDRYSMAPIFRAEREIQAEEAPAAAEETAAAPAPVAEDAAPSKVVTISQPADDGSVIVMIGQSVERNCGACFPIESGTVVGFIDVPDGVVIRGGVYALIRWDNRRDRPERVRLSDIHRRGWRSANGSPLGVFVC
ncbi:hypothetical protein [Oscillibacter sp. 1-3]|uniref:hypothetical protein n=1 Tax=Oscillibacter sp. 1-3 TaxID=1235797 RepID=UPI0003411DC2|nr:hypothetical protein [Oscillibacter sp. 1-3]EOS64601.1 hypothetical protein C816_02847 [Oscillibacter sp. 1-3]